MEVPKDVKKGRLFAEAKIRGHTVKALVDTGADNNFLTLQEAKRMGIRYETGRSWIKGVNSAPTETFGVARNVKVSLGN